MILFKKKGGGFHPLTKTQKIILILFHFGNTADRGAICTLNK